MTHKQLKSKEIWGNAEKQAVRWYLAFCSIILAGLVGIMSLQTGLQSTFRFQVVVLTIIIFFTILRWTFFRDDPNEID